MTRGCPLADRVLAGSADFPAHTRGDDATAPSPAPWTPCILRLTARGVLQLPSPGAPDTDAVWGLEWRHAGSPAAVLLARGPGDPGDAVALVARSSTSPRVFAVRDAGALAAGRRPPPRQQARALI